MSADFTASFNTNLQLIEQFSALQTSFKHLDRVRTEIDIHDTSLYSIVQYEFMRTMEMQYYKNCKKMSNLINKLVEEMETELRNM